MGELLFKRHCPITVYISFGPVTECDDLNPLQLIVGLLGFAQDVWDLLLFGPQPHLQMLLARRPLSWFWYGYDLVRQKPPRAQLRPQCAFPF